MNQNDLQHEGTEASQETTDTEITTAGTTAVAVKPASVGGAYIKLLLENEFRGFLEANEGMDLDYVRMGSWLRLTKLGKFVEADDETVNYGDHIDVVVGMAKKRFMLWGADGSPEKGKLIVHADTQEEAEVMLANFFAEVPDAAARYTVKDIDLRYLAYVVPVSTIQASIENDEPPKVYLMDFPYGDTIGWGKHAMAIYGGKFKQQGVKRGSGANSVVTRIGAEERKAQNGDSYVGRVFTCVGPFVPSEYGITQE